VIGIFRSKSEVDRHLSKRLFVAGRLSEEIKTFHRIADKIDRLPGSELLEEGTFNAESLEIRDPVRISEVAKLLYQWGYVCFPSLVPYPLLNELRREFVAVLENGFRYGQAVDEFDASTTVRLLMAELDRSDLKATWDFFNSRIMNDFSRVYFRGEPFLFNYEIFVQETGPTESPPSGDLHFDKRHTLKFWIYLDDTPAEAGAMRIVPGSIREARGARMNHMARKAPLSRFDNIISVQNPEIPVAGPAGTVFIHDTDAVHGAGTVENGYRRRIMRGHCRTKRTQSWIEKNA